MQDELTTNIYYSNDLLAVSKTQEKDLAKVLRKEVTLEDYKNDDLVNLIISYTIANISDDQANELSEYSDFLSPQQDSLITEINYLYSYVKPLLDRMDEEMSILVRDYDAHLRTTANWYHLIEDSSDLPDTAYDYFLNDPFYLNEVAYYERIGLGNHLRYNIFFNTYAKDLYIDVSDYLKLEIDTTIIKPIEKFRHYIGTYELIDDTDRETFVIREENGKLVYDWIDEIDADTFSLYPETEDEFIIGRWFAKLNRNEIKEITGFTITLGNMPEKEYKKIN